MIIDLEGTASLMVANAIGMSDLVIIPTQGASMDAKGASKTIKLIRNQQRMAKRDIPYAVLLTRVSAAVASRSLKNVRDQLDLAGVEVFHLRLWNVRLIATSLILGCSVKARSQTSQQPRQSCPKRHGIHGRGRRAS